MGDREGRQGGSEKEEQGGETSMAVENRVGKDREDETWESGLFQTLLMLPETQRKECRLFLGPAMRFSLRLCACKHGSGRV